MTTVFVLAVLWLIVLVPMVVRRRDERRRDRSVAGFGRAMRALGRRATADPLESRSDVFVPSPPRNAVAKPARRPVPAAQEALMYPVDRSEMSAPRLRMMARRRRSLATLILGTIIFLVAGLLLGGLWWVPAACFAAGLLGYFYFLRSQALHDRERRATRQRRASERRPVGFDATEELARFDDEPTTLVRIDDDDAELHELETVDLTGLYSEDTDADRGVSVAAAERRAS
jgi:hypothetical protein